MNEDATTLRWLIQHRWTDAESQVEALRLVDKWVGYPGPSATEGRSEEVTTRPRRKVAVVVGHNSGAPGADALPPIDATEYEFNGKIALWMAANAPDGIEIKMFLRRPGLKYGAEISEVYGQVNRWGAEASIELHFNSAELAATGTEVVVGANGNWWAERVQKVMCTTLSLRDRGVKRIARTERGAGSVYAIPAIPQILVEPFFGSNPGDCARVAKLGVDGMGRMYLEGILALGDRPV